MIKQWGHHYISRWPGWQSEYLGYISRFETWSAPLSLVLKDLRTKMKEK